MTKKYYKDFVKDYYIDLNNMIDLLKKLTDSYRLLVASAAELNNINEARTSAVKEAVKRAEKLGHCIDHLIDLVDECGDSYYEYCLVVNKYIKTNGSKDVILTEVNDEILFQNNVIRPDDKI